jgi:hypothetical protein
METLTYEAYLEWMHKHWHLSEHIGIVAPTGAGKSWIARDLLLMKKHAVVVATKAKDKTLDRYIKEDGFYRIDRWPPEWYQTHVLLWKSAKELGEYRPQQVLIYYAMNDIYKRGGYALYFDDLYYVAETLKLKKPVQMLYTQVRSNGVSLIASMQRPAWVPLEAVSQSTYLLVGRIRDERDVERSAAGMGISKKMLLTAIAELQEFEFLLLQSGKDPIHIQRRQ